MNSENENIPLTKRVKGQKIEIREVETPKPEPIPEPIPEPSPIQETKKPLSDKKREQMEKARLKKMENAEKRKEEKKIEAYKALLEKGYIKEDKPKPVELSDSEIDTETDSEPEEIIVVKKKKSVKKPKKKTKKIIIEESESDTDSGSDGGNTPPPAPVYKQREMVSQKSKPQIDYSKFFC